jgi:hypothetical protein
MSRTTVRADVAAFFQPPTVTGLNKVYTSFPKRIPGGDFRYGQSSGTKSGAVGVVYIAGEREERIAIGGATSGKKWVHYTVELHVFCHSIELHAEDAMAFFDTTIDNVKARLRSDRTLGDYPVIFEAGERDLSAIYGEPKVLNDGASEVWGRVRFEVSEVLTT